MNLLGPDEDDMPPPEDRNYECVKYATPSTKTETEGDHNQ